MAVLVLARHGETDWNRDGRWQGRRGGPLNAEGRRQAKELADLLDGIDAIYASPSRRARQTAEIAAARLGLDVRVDTRLAEVHFGSWEGLTTPEIERRYPGATDRWNAGEESPPDGESDETMAERVLDALREIAREHEDGRVLVVTSGGPIRAAEAELRGIDQRSARRLVATVENCSLVELVVRGDVFTSP